MIRAIIFDLDGTIGDTLPLCIAAFRKSIEPLAGRAVSDEEIVATFGPSEEGTIRALVPDHYEEGVERYLAHYRELHPMCGRPFDGIADILDFARARGVRLAMVTGKGARSTDITLEAFGLRHAFEIVETGSPHGPRKAEGIRSVLDRFEIEAGEAVYVGDAPSDIEASRKVGVAIVSAAWAGTADPEALRALAPDELFTDVAGFRQYLERVC
ncbi:HAD family hydrolase [Paenibacillus sp.]|uniref:HAD family hydrolase n=1 Tax=Paenibacillus sp. TaxID=58172 RepID=UPI002D691001|nr:HAD family hydrolase [Paenibacillus sp.]HZG84999.1 HAD family hydrolase [Paenibacillus sp.]